MSDGNQPSGWERGWHDHDTQQLRRLAALPLRDKIKWLEEAHRLVRHLSAARAATSERPRGGPVKARHQEPHGAERG